MLKISTKNLLKTSLTAATLGVTLLLSGCMQHAQHEPGNGLSVGTLNKQTINDSTVLAWSNEAAVSTFSYDHQNYQQNLQKASQYFTPAGWQAYMTSLSASGTLTKVIKHKMSVSAVNAGGAPVILAKDDVAGRFSWKVQLPLIVTYKSADAENVQHLIVTLLVVRTSTEEGVRGLGIKQFIALEAAQLQNHAVATVATDAANANSAA